MTICLGALCADSTGKTSRIAVVASDRMVTLGGLIEFEHEVPKVSNLSGKVLALVAGDALRGSRLIRDVSASLPVEPSTVDEIVKATVQWYVTHRRQQIEAEIFTPRGVSMQDFYTGLQQRLIQPLVGSIDQQVITYNYGVELLIAGVDGDGAHLHAIENPGTEEDFAQIGYAAIGSGGLHALQSMIGFGHAGMHGLNDTVFSVYASKRRAEVAPGVGKDTDLAIITEDSIQYLEQSVLKELDALYGEYQRPVMQDLKSKVAELSFLKKRGE